MPIRGIAALLLLLTVPVPARAGGFGNPPGVPETIDWRPFMARHDLVWKRLPTHWEDGPFLGNGLLGAVMYAEDGAPGWELGRSDLTDHRAPETHPLRAQPRLPLGRMVLETGAPVTGMDARLDLWNGEVAGTLTTAHGPLRFRSYVHAEQPVLMVELGPGDGRFVYHPAIPINDRLLVRKQEAIAPGDLNPAPFVEERGAMRLAVQRRTGGGEHVVAWQEKPLPGKGRLLVVSVATSITGSGARAEAAGAVERALARGLE